MVKQKKSAAPQRTSGRVSKAVPRYRPAAADIPEPLLALIRDVANGAAAKSAIKFEPVCASARSLHVAPTAHATRGARSPQGAVVALEEALEPILEALCNAALKHAERNGRTQITVEDLSAVSKTYMKGKGKK